MIKKSDVYNETFRILREAKNDKRLVPFLGAGISVESGLPLWKSAIKEIADALSLNENDDILKIPQYYFNARGKKEYTEFMRKIFKYGDDLNTTPVHKALIKLDIPTIVTTNYDHLIEKAAKENGEIMQVVSQDADLPYLKYGHQLIKIHGDFEHDNFVLKEDDYLHYSTNFKLIETYIKSLIGSKVILFIGYSLNDPDIKHIFSWAKEILGQNFQRAYMILTCTEPNDIEREYFKNLGVNIIYANELIEGTNDNHTEQILGVIELISSKGTSTLLDEIHNDIFQMNNLNYVYGKYIQNVLYKYNIICDHCSINMWPNEKAQSFNVLFDTLWRFFKGEDITNTFENRNDINALNDIKDVIEKSRFTELYYSSKHNHQEIKISNNNANDIEELMISFDYEGMHTLLDNSIHNLSLSNPDLLLKAAFICIALNDYGLAYNFLKNAGSLFYSNKSYVWYYITIFNQKYVGKLLQNISENGLSEEERKNIIQESKAIDLDKLLNSIPNTNQENFSFLKEIGSFSISYTLFYDVFKDYKKVNEEATTNYTIFTGTAAYEKIRISIRDYISYIFRNYIMIDKYNEFLSIIDLYIRSILSSIKSDEIKPNSDIAFAVGNIRVQKIGKLELFVLIKYINSENIKKMFNAYGITTLPVVEEGDKYITDIFDNITMYQKYVEYNIYNEDPFWRYLAILSYMSISKEMAMSIFVNLTSREKHEIERNKNTIYKFSVNVCNHDLFKSKDVCNIIKKFVDKIIDEDIYIECTSLIKHLCYICYKGKKPYNEKTRIKKVSNAKDIGLIIDLYDKLSVNAQKQIKKVIACWNPKSFYDYCYYCEAALVGALEWNEKAENELYDLINCNKEEESQGIIVHTYPNYNESDVINALCNLYLNKKIINESKLKEIVNKSSMELQKWLLNMDTYDYSKFDCHWLETSSPSLLKSISKKPVIVKNILKAYKKLYDTNDAHSKITDIITKYFLVIDDESEALNN